MNWCDPTLKQFAKAVIDCGTLYYMKGRGGYAAVEGSLPGFTAFMPLWASQEAANSQRCGEWEKYVIRPQPVDGLRYFKDDFVMNGWAAACYIEATDEWVEVSFLTLLAAVIREKGRRRIRKGNQRWGDDTHGSRHDARPEASSMSQDLREALDRFVARAKAKNGHVSELPALAAFDTRFPGIMPAWYREVLEKSAIGDITFDATAHLGLGWTPSGHFRDAETLLIEIDGVFPDEELAKNGYLSIGAAGDGDCWVIRSSSTADDPVFLCRMSAYGTNDPADSKECLLKHSESFAAFLDEIEPTPNTSPLTKPSSTIVAG